MIEPSGIPQFVGNLDQLEKDVSALRSDAIGVRNGGKDVHSRFQALAGVYKAPEDTQLFDTTRPVMDKAEAFATKLETVADALDTFSIEARPLAKQLAHLKADALAFVDSVAGDDDWTYDEDKIDRHQKLIDGVSAAESAFRDAERRAAGKISALVGGPRFVVDDGSHTVNDKSVMYGYGLEALKHAKELPWGTPESESHHAWEVGYWAKSYVWDGLVVDNIWGGIKGLGTLVGIGPEDTSDAWGHIWDMVGGIGQYTAKPYDWVMDHTIGPDEESADEVRQKHAAKDFGKGLVAWDMWGENPARASATVTFNLLTLGAGPAAVAAKGGEAGALAKAAGTASKVGTYLDPLSAGLTVGGKAISALPKLSEVTAGIRNVFDTTASSQRLHSVIELSDGSKVLIKDGKFIPVNAEGKVSTTAPHQEKPADLRGAREETPTERGLAMVGAHSRVPEATARAGENLPLSGSHELGGAGHSAAISHGAGRTLGGSEAGTSTGSGAHGGGHAGTGRAGSGPDGLGGTGDDAGRAGDEAAAPTNHGSEGAGNGGEPPLTAAQRKKLLDEHIWKANNDEAWLNEHYDILGRRRSVSAKVDGVELPLLAKDANGKWISKFDLPHGPSEIKQSRTALTPASVDPVHRPGLDAAAKNRKVSVDLTNAEKAFDGNPTATAQKVLDDAQNAYRQQLGDTPNNSKLSEKLGEQAAELHVVPKEFPGAEWVELPKTPNGADMFDQVYKLGDDGKYLIVEAKAPSGDLGWRKGSGSAQGIMVKQGTKEYVHTILTEMWKRGGKDRTIADSLFDALEDGKLQYVLVKATDNTGSYAGAVLEHFKIY